MPSAYLVPYKGKEQTTWAVKYRLHGRYGKIGHAGSFKTKEDAEIRLGFVRRQLAAGATKIRDTDIPRADVTRWVYFVRHGSHGPIKIGSTGNVARRIAGLQSGNPVALQLLAVIPCHDDEEHRLHQAFAADRVSGEWFRPTPELLAYIAEFSSEDEWENGL